MSQPTLRPPGVAVVGLLSAAACLLLAVALWWSTSRSPAEPASPGAPSTATAPSDVLRAWDEERARAWADGDVEALRALYAPRAAVGRRDVAMLERYVDRGLVVEGLVTQLLEVREVSRDDDAWVLEVADRVHGGTVVGQGVRRALPRDSADRRRLTLRRHGSGWRMVSAVALPGGGSGGGESG